MEYKNIISNLKLGNIEADPEIVSLYEEVMNTISGKLLAREASERIQKEYDEWERKQIINSVMGILGTVVGLHLYGTDEASAKSTNMGLRVYGTDPVTFGTVFAISCVSSYFAYQEESRYFRTHLAQELYKIGEKEHESYNALQTRLLNSSWRLMRQYRLPDEYRITQDDVNDFFRAVNENDSSKRLSMLRALEGEFRIYPPYWIYRARSAQRAGKSEEAAECYAEFGKVWRPVLRNDPFRLEAAKYHVQEALKSGNHDEALSQLAIVRENTPRSDWADNLFAGVVYFILGQNEKGINCAELNINFEAEKEISGIVVAQMKAGKLDAETLPAELGKIIGLSELRYDTIVSLAKDGDLEAQLTLGKMYAEGKIVSKDYAESMRWYKKAAEQNDETAIFSIASLYAQGGPNVETDYSLAVKWFKKLADKGNEAAVLGIAGLYMNGGPNLTQDYRVALTWYEKAAYDGNKTGANRIAQLYFTGGPNLTQSYYNAYVWCCVAEMAEKSGAATAGLVLFGGVAAIALSGPLLPLVGIGYLWGNLIDDYSIKEQIEGAGIFNLAKLSDSEMDKAKIEAGKIMAKIERNIKEKQEKLDNPAP